MPEADEEMPLNGGSSTRPSILKTKSYRGVTVYGSVGDREDSPSIVTYAKGTLDKSSSSGRRAAFRSVASSSLGSGKGSFRDSVHSFSRTSFRLPGEACSVRDLGGRATVSTQVFNLTKNIIGAGVLALPSGIAAFGNAPSALFPAALLTAVTGAIFGYYFSLIGRVCKLTMTATYRESWEKTVGEAGSAFVALVIILKAALANLTYSMILADAGRSVLETLGVRASRSAALVGVTVSILLPLCLLKNLAVLAPFSLVGLAGMLFTLLAMTLRYFDGTYDAERNGLFLSDLDERRRPAFGSTGAGGALGPNALVFACMLFEAYVAHYNAPRFFVELKDNTIPRFNGVTVSSFGISVVFFILAFAVGFLAFGSASSGFILNNYSSKDILATISRVAIFVAVVTTYPLVFLGTRDGVLDLLIVPTELQTSSNLNVLSVVILTIITVTAAFVTNLGLVAAVGGGTLATAVVFIFPALMFRFAIRNEGAEAS